MDRFQSRLLKLTNQKRKLSSNRPANENEGAKRDVIDAFKRQPSNAPDRSDNVSKNGKPVVNKTRTHTDSGKSNKSDANKVSARENEIKLIFTPLYASERGCDCVLNNVYVCMYLIIFLIISYNLRRRSTFCMTSCISENKPVF